MALFTNVLTPWVFARDFVAIFVFYFLGAFFMPRMLFLELLNGMLAAISIMVSVIYSADIWGRMREGVPDGVITIRIGIVLSWTVSWVQAASRVYFIEFHPGVGGRTFDALVGAPALILIIAAALHLIAIGMIGNNLVRRNLRIVSWSLLFGIGAVLALSGVHYLFGES